MIKKDASTVVSECSHNLEHHLLLSVMLLELSIMLLELSIMLLENIYNTSITHYGHPIMIVIYFLVQATDKLERFDCLTHCCLKSLAGMHLIVQLVLKTYYNHHRMIIMSDACTINVL